MEHLIKAFLCFIAAGAYLIQAGIALLILKVLGFFD